MDADADDGSPPFPVVVRVAGVLWALQGGLVAAAGVAAGVVLAGVGGLEVLLVFPAIVAVLGAFGGWVGVEVARGRVAGVRAPGAVSVGLGALFGLHLAFSAVTGHVDRWHAVNVGGVAVALALPGVLAFAGAAGYDRWREHRHPPGA